MYDYLEKNFKSSLAVFLFVVVVDCLFFDWVGASLCFFRCSPPCINVCLIMVALQCCMGCLYHL